MSAAIDYIRIAQPGSGRDIAVPGPLGLIAVTLETVFLGRNARCRAIPIRLGNHWGVGVILSNGQ
jgi:hypothetical protein